MNDDPMHGLKETNASAACWMPSDLSGPFGACAVEPAVAPAAKVHPLLPFIAVKPTAAYQFIVMLQPLHLRGGEVLCCIERR